MGRYFRLYYTAATMNKSLQYTVLINSFSLNFSGVLNSPLGGGLSWEKLAQTAYKALRESGRYDVNFRFENVTYWKETSFENLNRGNIYSNNCEKKKKKKVDIYS